MSAILQQLQAQAAQAAAVGPDMNEAQKGGGGSKLLPNNVYAFGRIVEYIDLGSQPQEYQGKAKDPADEFRLGIALWGDGITNEDGTPYILRPYSIAISRFEKSNTYKMFKALNYTGDTNIKHFAQFVGQAFLFKLEHHTSKAGKVSSVINWGATLPPYDAVTRQPYQIPAAPDDAYRLFLWDFPTIEAWNSLHIEGTNDDGKSKNFIQDTILGALNFEGSPLHQLLVGNNVAFTVPPKKAAPAVPAAPQAAVAPPVAQPTAPVSAPAVAAPEALHVVGTPPGAPALHVPTSAAFPTEAPAQQGVAAPLAQPAAAPAVAAPGQANGAAQPQVTGSQVPSVPTATTSRSEAVAAPVVAPAAVSLPVMPPAVSA